MTKLINKELIKYLELDQRSNLEDLCKTLDLDLNALLSLNPLALYEAKKLYPQVEVKDTDVLVGALSLSVKFIGVLDVLLFLKDHPTLFIYCSLCSWFHYHIEQGFDLFYKQRHYYTILTALLGTGYTLDDCSELLKRLQLPDPVKGKVLEELEQSFANGIVVYSMNAEAQGASIH